MKYLALLPYLLACLLSLPTIANENDCQTWPQGMVFVGLTETGWQTYAVMQAGKPPKKFRIETEMRTPVFSLSGNTLFYVDDAANVKAFSLMEKNITVVLAVSPAASYTQLEIDEKNNALYAVELKQGNSVDTDIVRVDLASNTATPLIIQRSAQFEPTLSLPWLYYSNVHCVLGCGKIIQEVWRYHTASGIAEQVTLLNNISRQPTVDKANRWLYFSSNAAGNYYIYRQSLTTKHEQPEQLTRGAVTDISPAAVDDRLYFIRHQAQGATLMCRSSDGELHVLPLPKGVKQLRDLEI